MRHDICISEFLPQNVKMSYFVHERVGGGIWARDEGVGGIWQGMGLRSIREEKGHFSK